MNATSETKTGTNRGAEEQTFIVLGVLLQFLSTPEQINDQISVMRGTLPSGVVTRQSDTAGPAAQRRCGNTGHRRQRRPEVA